jgi:hypothetical protein
MRAENNALLVMKSAIPDLLIQYAMEHTQFRGVCLYEYCLDLLIGLSARGNLNHSRLLLFRISLMESERFGQEEVN